MPDRKIRFLIADDDPLILLQLALLIETAGEEVVARATNGQQALAAFDQHKPDIMVLDVVMPELDGFEVWRQIRANTDIAVPVIFVSANYSTECAGLELGASEFLSKPFDPQVVLARLQSQITLIRSRRALQAPIQALQDERELLTEIVERMRHVHAFDQRYISYSESPSEKTEGNTVLSAFRPDQSQHVLVGNFSSYGIPAALGSALVTHIFYRFSAENLPLSEVLCELNRVLYRQFPPQVFMAACAIEIDAQRQHARLWNFGLHPAICIDARQQTHQFHSCDLPLGILAETRCHQAHLELQLAVWDRFYLFSKAINTTRSQRAEQYDTGKLEQLLTQIHQQHLSLDAIWPQLSEYNKKYDWSDDAVLVAVSV